MAATLTLRISGSGLGENYGNLGSWNVYKTHIEEWFSKPEPLYSGICKPDLCLRGMCPSMSQVGLQFVVMTAPIATPARSSNVALGRATKC